MFPHGKLLYKTKFQLIFKNRGHSKIPKMGHSGKNLSKTASFTEMQQIAVFHQTANLVILWKW